MNDEEYIEVEFGDETYLVAPEGRFTGDESRRDVRVLESDEVSDFEIGVEQAGTRVGVDPSQYDSVEEMYRDAVEKAQELNSGSVEDEFFSEDPLEALDMYGGE